MELVAAAGQAGPMRIVVRPVRGFRADRHGRPTPGVRARRACSLGRPSQHVSVALAAVLVAGACVGVPQRGRPAPPTSLALRADHVGVILSSVLDELNSRAEVVLEDGTRFTLEYVNGATSSDPDTATVRLTIANFPGFETGTLLLVGHEPDGQGWYAFAYPHDWICEGLYRLGGDGIYDEGQRLHFSNGLVLPKVPGFTLGPPGYPTPFWLNSGDHLCIDASGAAVRAYIDIGE